MWFWQLTAEQFLLAAFGCELLVARARYEGWLVVEMAVVVAEG